MRLIVVFSLLVWILLSACNLQYGFIESEFQLAAESRLPRWFVVPPGYKREDLGMTITLYFRPFLPYLDKMVIYDLGPGHKELLKKIGTERWHPCTARQFEEKKTGAVYPNYSIVTVDGIEEIFEQRVPGNILYITDDPQLRHTIDRC
ncbi:MAG TPA: hypothetical protein VLY20_10660 [Nitrospiria bacterium]|nr:hypothetical protein [Nitrospiria bacterium]